MYSFKKDEWVKEYAHDLSSAEKEKIYASFKEAVKESGEKMPIETYGPVAEDRGGQITFRRRPECPGRGEGRMGSDRKEAPAYRLVPFAAFA